MRKRFAPASLVLVCLTGCTSTPLPVAEGVVVPSGARLDAQGMASILAVPPSPWPASPPPEPASTEPLFEKYARENTLSLAEAEAQINGSPAFQREMQALAQRLNREQPDNFVGMRIVRDPAVTAEFAFLRSPRETLARYTRNPQFRAVQGGKTEAQLEPLRALWTRRLTPLRTTFGMGTNAFAGRLEVDLGLSEREFRAIAADQGWTWGDEVRFTFAPEAPPVQVAPGARYPFHLFPRSKAAATIILTAAISGTVVLDHGCFRLAGRDGKPGNLVLFDRSAQIGQDGEGYLAVFAGGKPSARIGEPAIWGGYPGAVERDPDVIALRRACGDGPIESVGVPESVRLSALPYPEWVANYAQAKKISYAAAWKRVIACMKRYEEANGPPRFLEARDACIKQFN